MSSNNDPSSQLSLSQIRDLVNELRKLGVTKYQDGSGIVLELAQSAPSDPVVQPAPGDKPEFTATLEVPHSRKLDVLFKHSNLKPGRLRK